MKNFLSFLIFNIFVFASSTANSAGGAKSHSIELLHWGRHTPMSFHENTLISSKSFVSSKSRSVQVYNIENDGNSSLLQNLSSPNPSAGDDFGFSIDHNDNYLIIGSPGFNEGNGAAYLYKKKSNQWVYEKTFLNPEIQLEGRPHKFGYSVNLNDQYLAISSPFNKDGIVYIYSIEQHIPEDKVKINSFKTIDVQKIGNVAGCYSEGPDRFAFGLSSSMNDKYLLIGSLKDFAYLVTFNNNEASGKSFIFPTTEIDKDDDINEKLRFAESVYVGDESIYISSLGYNHDSGAVLKYDKLQNSSNWFLSDFIFPESDQNHHHRSEDLENNYFGFRITETNNKVFISSFNNPKIHKYSKNNYKLIFENHFGNNAEKLDKYSSRNIVAENDILVSDAYYSEKIFIHNVANNRSNNSLNEILTSESRNSIFSRINCVNGYAGNYQCNKIDLMSYIDKTEIGGINSTILNDIWGWTDPQTGKEYALVGMSNGTSFVDISNPELPIFIGRLPTQTSNSTWRDIKVYNDHAFIVSEAGGHGMQVFDLTELRSFDGSTAVNFSNSAYYNGFGNAHNIFINEDTGFAYAIGTTTCGPGGLHIVDINSPKSPVKSACISDPSTGRNGTGYSHDVQCVVYNGPDSAYVGKEICFGSNETHVWISDVSEKSDDNSGSKTIGLGSYDSYYTHQGWLTEDHKYFIVNDELDESNNATGGKTRTLIWDVQDLDSPTLFKVYYGPNSSIDHNNYVVGDEVYMSHYSSGLRVLDISDIANPSEKAFFDVHPSNNNVNFDGSWSNYPFFDSKNIIVTAIDDGLFVVQKSSNLSAPFISVSVPEDGSVLIKWQFNDLESDKIRLYRSTVQSFNTSPSNLIGEFDRSTNSYLDSNLNSQTTYFYKAISLSGLDEGPVSSEVVVLPTFIPNIQPTIDSISDLVIDEDVTASIILTGISYGNDINNQQVTVSALASDASLIKDLIISPNLSDDSEYTLTIVPEENIHGSTNIVVIVSDDGGTFEGGIDNIEVYFNLTINSVNDYPTAATQVGELVVSSNEYLMYSSIEGLNRFLSIDINNISDSLRFEWNESIDVDGDEVKYKLVGYEDLSFLSMDEFSTENYKTWAFKDIINQLPDPLQIYSGYWRVVSTDGELNTLSNSLNGKLFIDGIGLIPENWGIKQSYPNPFRGFTTIEYEVPSTENVIIRIYNLKGQIVKTLIDEKVDAGYKTVIWDGTNDNDNEVSSGIYFCQIFTPNSSSTKYKKAIKLTKLR